MRVWFFWLSFGVGLLGALLYQLPNTRRLPGIKNDGIFFSPNKSRGWIGISIGTFLIGFYIVLYFYPEYITNWVLLVDPISRVLSGGPASQWTLYGFLYTLCILVMGIPDADQIPAQQIPGCAHLVGDVFPDGHRFYSARCPGTIERALPGPEEYVAARLFLLLRLPHR